MNTVVEELRTKKSVQECGVAFREAVKVSYGAGRKFMKVVATVGTGGRAAKMEFFTPRSGPASGGKQPDLSLGANVPGYSKFRGTTSMTVHVYVIDEGSDRFVQLVGPYGLGERGSTERLVKSIAKHF